MSCTTGKSLTVSWTFLLLPKTERGSLLKHQNVPASPRTAVLAALVNGSWNTRLCWLARVSQRPSTSKTSSGVQIYSRMTLKKIHAYLHKHKAGSSPRGEETCKRWSLTWNNKRRVAIIARWVLQSSTAAWHRSDRLRLTSQSFL